MMSAFGARLGEAHQAPLSGGKEQRYQKHGIRAESLRKDKRKRDYDCKKNRKVTSSECL